MKALKAIKSFNDLNPIKNSLAEFVSRRIRENFDLGEKSRLSILYLGSIQAKDLLFPILTELELTSSIEKFEVHILDSVHNYEFQDIENWKVFLDRKSHSDKVEFFTHEVDLDQIDFEQEFLKDKLKINKANFFDIVLVYNALHKSINWRLASYHLLEVLNEGGQLVFSEAIKDLAFLDGKLDQIPSSQGINITSTVRKKYYDFCEKFYSWRNKYFFWDPEISPSDSKLFEVQFNNYFDGFVSDEFSFQRKTSFSDIQDWVNNKASSYFSYGLENQTFKFNNSAFNEKDELLLDFGLKVHSFENFKKGSFDKIGYWRAKNLIDRIERLPDFKSKLIGQTAIDLLLSHDMILPAHTYFFGILPWDVRHDRWVYPLHGIINQTLSKGESSSIAENFIYYYLILSEEIGFSLIEYFSSKLNRQIAIEIKLNNEKPDLSLTLQKGKRGNIKKMIIEIPSNFNDRSYIRFPNLSTETFRKPKNKTGHQPNDDQEFKNPVYTQVKPNLTRLSISQDFYFHLTHTYCAKYAKGKENVVMANWDKYDADKYTPVFENVISALCIPENDLPNIIKSLYGISRLLGEMERGTKILMIPSIVSSEKKNIKGSGCLLLIEKTIQNYPHASIKSILDDRNILLTHITSRIFHRMGIISLAQSGFRIQALKAAIAAVISRNGSHGIGSNVLPLVGFDTEHGPFALQALIKYLRQRFDFIAQVASGFPRWTFSAWFNSDIMMRFYMQFHLLDKLVKAEGLSAHQYRYTNHTPEVDLGSVFQNEGLIRGGSQNLGIGDTIIVQGWTRKRSGLASNTFVLEKDKVKIICEVDKEGEETKGLIDEKLDSQEFIHKQFYSDNFQETGCEVKIIGTIEELIEVPGKIQVFEGEKKLSFLKFKLVSCKYIQHKLQVKVRRRSYIDLSNYSSGQFKLENYSEYDYSIHGKNVVDISNHELISRREKEKLRIHIYGRVTSVSSEGCVIELGDQNSIEVEFDNFSDVKQLTTNKYYIISGLVFKNLENSYLPDGNKLIIKFGKIESELGKDKYSKLTFPSLTKFCSPYSIHIYDAFDTKKLQTLLENTQKLKIFGYLKIDEKGNWKVFGGDNKKTGIQIVNPLPRMQSGRWVILEGRLSKKNRFFGIDLLINCSSYTYIEETVEWNVTQISYNDLVRYKTQDSIILLNSVEEIEKKQYNIKAYGAVQSYRKEAKKLWFLSENNPVSCVLNYSDFDQNNSLWGHLVVGTRLIVQGEIEKEGEEFRIKNAKILELVKTNHIVGASSIHEETKRLGHDVQIAIPGGVVGYQAIYCILENIIRNSSKHDWAKLPEVEKAGKNLEIKIELEDRLNEDFLICRIWNNARDLRDSFEKKDINGNFVSKAGKTNEVLVNWDPRFYYQYKSSITLNESNVPRETRERFSMEQIPLHHKLNFFFCDPLIDNTGSLIREHLGISETKIVAGFLNVVDIETIGSESMEHIMLDEYSHKNSGFVRSTAVWEEEGGQLIPRLATKIKLLKPREIGVFSSFGPDKLIMSIPLLREFNSHGIYFFSHKQFEDLDFEICIILDDGEKSKTKRRPGRDEKNLILYLNRFIDSEQYPLHEIEEDYVMFKHVIGYYPYRLLLVLEDKKYESLMRKRLDFPFIFRRIRFIRQSRFDSLLAYVSSSWENTTAKPTRHDLDNFEKFKLYLYQLWINLLSGNFSKNLKTFALSVNYQSPGKDDGLREHFKLDQFFYLFNSRKSELVELLCIYIRETVHGEVESPTSEILEVINSLVKYFRQELNSFSLTQTPEAYLPNYFNRWIEGVAYKIQDKIWFTNTYLKAFQVDDFWSLVTKVINVVPSIVDALTVQSMDLPPTVPPEYTHIGSDSNEEGIPKKRMKKSLEGIKWHEDLNKAFINTPFADLPKTILPYDVDNPQVDTLPIVYSRHGSAKKDQNKIHLELLSGSQISFSILKEPPDDDYFFFKLLLQLIENALPVIMVLDERLGRFVDKYKDVLPKRLQNINIIVPISISYASKNISIPIAKSISGKDEVEILVSESDPVVIKYDGSRFSDFHLDKSKNRGPRINTLIMHYAVLEKLFNEKQRREFVLKVKEIIPSVIITSGRGEPSDLGNSVKFLPYSNIESFLLQPYPEKFLLTQIIMKAILKPSQ
ncbi:MAG: hypothetical protein AAF502_23540 [Bacteroidota bacterium]